MKPFIVALGLMAFALSGCSGKAGFDGTVEVGDNFFKPRSATVDAGTEVHFEMDEDAENTHNIMIHKVGDATTTLKLEEEGVEAGTDTHYTFATAGTYHVWCNLHGTMTTGMAMEMTVE